MVSAPPALTMNQPQGLEIEVLPYLIRLKGVGADVGGGKGDDYVSTQMEEVVSSTVHYSVHVCQTSLSLSLSLYTYIFIYIYAYILSFHLFLFTYFCTNHLIKIL